jgi:ankyrin repeat protein
MLIARDADVNAANQFGGTALWRAADVGRADVVEALLLAGADVNKADLDGTSESAPPRSALACRISNCPRL